MESYVERYWRERREREAAEAAKKEQEQQHGKTKGSEGQTKEKAKGTGHDKTGKA